MTTPTPTLPESAADVGDLPVKAIKESHSVNVREWALRYGGSIASKHMPKADFATVTDLAGDIAEALQTVFDMQEAKALASRSTQPEGEADGQPDWKIVDEYGQAERAVQNAGTSSRTIFDQALARREQTRETLLARMASLAAPKSLPQPEAAASGDVERVAAAICIAQGDNPDREGPFIEWFRESPYSAMAEAAIRAMMPQPSAPAGEVPKRKSFRETAYAFARLRPSEITDITDRLNVDANYFGPHMSDLGRIRGVISFVRDTGAEAEFDRLVWQIARPRQPEPGSTQGVEAR